MELSTLICLKTIITKVQIIHVRINKLSKPFFRFGVDKLVKVNSGLLTLCCKGGGSDLTHPPKKCAQFSARRAESAQIH